MKITRELKDNEIVTALIAGQLTAAQMNTPERGLISIANVVCMARDIVANTMLMNDEQQPSCADIS